MQYRLDQFIQFNIIRNIIRHQFVSFLMSEPTKQWTFLAQLFIMIKYNIIIHFHNFGCYNWKNTRILWNVINAYDDQPLISINYNWLTVISYYIAIYHSISFYFIINQQIHNYVNSMCINLVIFYMMSPIHITP